MDDDVGMSFHRLMNEWCTPCTWWVTLTLIVCNYIFTKSGDKLKVKIAQLIKYSRCWVSIVILSMGTSWIISKILIALEVIPIQINYLECVHRHRNKNIPVETQHYEEVSPSASTTNQFKFKWVPFSKCLATYRNIKQYCNCASLQCHTNILPNKHKSDNTVRTCT